MKTVIVLAIATLKYRITVINVGRIRRGCMVDVFTLLMQSVCLTTNVVNSNPVHGEVCSIQLYVIKFAGDLRQVGGFLRFTQPLKLTTTI